MNNTFQHRIIRYQQATLDIWRRYWLLRWTVANMVGWSGALLLAALLLEWFGIWGALFGGALIGTIVGIFQSMILRTDKAVFSPQQWILWSMVGGACATVPVYLLGFVALLHLQIGLMLMGALFGGIIGGLQFRLLAADHDDMALWWIIANIIAGSLCGPLTLTRSILPLIGTLGPVTFGIVTGMALLHMQRAQRHD